MAAASGIEYRETQLFNRQDYVPGVGRSNAFIGHAHALSVGEISGPLDTENGYYVIEVLERKEIDTESFEKEKGRVAVLALSESRKFQLTLELLPDADAVAAAEKSVAKLQEGTTPQIFRQLMPDWSLG